MQKPFPDLLTVEDMYLEIHVNRPCSCHRSQPGQELARFTRDGKFHRLFFRKDRILDWS